MAKRDEKPVVKGGVVQNECADEPNWKKACESCGAKPTHPSTDMCGPCTFGEADTAGGNW
jgi:ribosomal protein L37E